MSTESIESAPNTPERIDPMVIRDEKSGRAYTLDFSRETVRFAENRGFKVGEVTDFLVSKVPELFFYAFRKHHKNMARSQTDELLDRLGGLGSKEIERLAQLYTQTYKSVLVEDDDENETRKNAKLVVEL